jgi:hypothetical protein
LQSQEDTTLKNIIEINGVEYGFMPDLDSISLGQYADIETFIKNGIDKNLPELMAVLYSPIKLKKNDIYIIEPYDGDIRLRAEEMKQMSATQVHSALVFFYHFGSVLLTTLQLSLIEVLQGMKTPLQVNPLPTSGVGSE